MCLPQGSNLWHHCPSNSEPWARISVGVRTVFAPYFGHVALPDMPSLRPRVAARARPCARACARKPEVRRPPFGACPGRAPALGKTPAQPKGRARRLLPAGWGAAFFGPVRTPCKAQRDIALQHKPAVAPGRQPPNRKLESPPLMGLLWELLELTPPALSKPTPRQARHAVLRPVHIAPKPETPRRGRCGGGSSPPGRPSAAAALWRRRTREDKGCWKGSRPQAEYPAFCGVFRRRQAARQRNTTYCGVLPPLGAFLYMELVHPGVRRWPLAKLGGDT